MLQLRNLVKKYGDTVILNIPDLQLNTASSVINGSSRIIRVGLPKKAKSIDSFLSMPEEYDPIGWAKKVFTCKRSVNSITCAGEGFLAAATRFTNS